MLTTNCIGLMSGSSMDGLDIAACRICMNSGNSFTFELLASETVPLPMDLLLKIRALPVGSARDLALCDATFGKWTGQEVNKFISKYNLKTDLIGSHGHTIFHEPGLGYSSQIGHPAHIAAETGLPVVGDFRMSDIAYGGQGAPMIPIAEKLLWPDYSQFLNLGGIVNIAFHQDEEAIAYDVCAGNQLLNHLAEFKGMTYDRDGSLSLKGTLIPSVLNEYLSLDFFNKKAPKSLANDWVSNEVFPIFNAKKYPVEDLLVTAMEASAILIAKAVADNTHLLNESIMVSGGGAHHPGWINRINRQMQQHGFPNVYIPKQQIIDFKEAIMIALAGFLRWQNLPNFLSSVTGASAEVSGGAIYSPAGFKGSAG